MRELNLYKLWEVCSTLSLKESELQEQSIFISFLGNKSNFCAQTFESFLEYYSFSVEDETIIVFNDDGIPYENYNNNDFSDVPIKLLEMSEEDLDLWIEKEVDRQSEAQRVNKSAEKDRIREQIRQLTKQLEL